MGVMDVNRQNGSRLLSGFAHALPWALLALAFCAYLAFLNAHSALQIDSDMASEMILSRLLAQEGGILSRNWYYSTELRVLNTQLITSLLFRFCDSWHVVRVVSSGIHVLLMLASLYYLCRQMGSVRGFPIAGTILLLPFCKGYYRFVLHGLYYIPHIAFSFVSVGLAFHCGNARRKGQICVLLTASLVVAFGAGLGGPRQLMITYLPLLMASIACTGAKALRDDADPRASIAGEMWLLRPAFASLIGAMAGLYVNRRLLARTYTFSNMLAMRWKRFSLNGISVTLSHILAAFGYESGPVLSYRIVTNILSLMLFVALGALHFLVMRGKGDVDRKAGRLLCVQMMAVLCYAMLHSFTDFKTKEQYFLPIVVLLIPVLALGIVASGKKALPVRGVCWAMACMLVLNSGLFYRELSKKADNKALIPLVEALCEEGYRTGYGTFWRANVVTELSNGQVDMYDWLDSNKPDEDIIDVDMCYKWLQLKKHKNPPEGKVFLLITEQERSKYTLFRNLDSAGAAHRAGELLVYTYDDYESMASALGNG